MQRISVLLLVLLVCSATAMQAQAQAPKPDPEVKKLLPQLGHWTYEGEAKPGPLGPGGKSTGEMTCQMILGGFFMQCRSTDKGPSGETRSLMFEGYDPVNKNFSIGNYNDHGTRLSGVLTITGNTWTYEWKLGEQQVKGTVILAPDLASGTYKTEISPDGKTWTPVGESRYTKVPPAAKK
jgi:hypothetical protein